MIQQQLGSWCMCALLAANTVYTIMDVDQVLFHPFDLTSSTAHIAH